MAERKAFCRAEGFGGLQGSTHRDGGSRYRLEHSPTTGRRLSLGVEVHGPFDCEGWSECQSVTQALHRHMWLIAKGLVVNLDCPKAHLGDL